MIELDDVFVLYPVGDRQVAALRGLTLSVAARERVVVTGPSGSGKSTLVRLVTGLVRPSAGRAMVLDHDLGNASARAILALQRTGIGVITQSMANNLATELSGMHNVALQCRLAGASRTEAAELATAMLARLGVDHLADRALATISAGEAQRVALAAALAHRPRVIVADEPTGALDVDNANLVFDLLAELSDELGAALLVVSHDPSAARIGERVLDIRDGRLGAEALPDGEHRLVVDTRGWVRLPEPERLRTGIVTRAVIGAPGERDGDQPRQLVLLAPHDQPPPVDAGEPVDDHVVDHRQLVTVDAAARSIGSTRILAPTTIAIRAGEMHVVSGRSGSGKTTLLGLLAGFSSPDEGSVVRSEPAPRVAVGTAAPGFADTMSVRANIELACVVRGRHTGPELTAEIDELLTAVGLIELADRPVATLSGGERQRASIIRSLAGDAELVLLDEPTSQLDQGLARRVAAFLRQQARGGRAIVCASHEPELLAAADRIHSLSR